MPQETFASSQPEEYKRVESLREPQSYPDGSFEQQTIDSDNVTISGPPDKQIVDENQEQVLD